MKEKKKGGREGRKGKEENSGFVYTFKMYLWDLWDCKETVSRERLG